MLERDEFRLKRSGSLLPRPTRAGLSHMEFSMSRPCERRDPSVSAIALIAAARALVSALEQRPFFTFGARGDGFLRSQGRPAERLCKATTIVSGFADAFPPSRPGWPAQVRRAIRFGS